MNNETITINREELTEAFARMIKGDKMAELLSKSPTLTLFAMMINIELERELFGDKK